MDQRLKDVLERAKTWPPEARDELVNAAKVIEASLRPRKPAKGRVEQKGTIESEKPVSEMSVYEALMKAPKTGKLRVPRPVRVRYRPPFKF